HMPCQQIRDPDILDLSLEFLGETENDSNSGFGKCPDYGKERVSDGWCKDCVPLKRILDIGQAKILILII
ncbi:1579_t:CDS:1, partial [Funneliformis caledonium]